MGLYKGRLLALGITVTKEGLVKENLIQPLLGFGANVLRSHCLPVTPAEAGTTAIVSHFRSLASAGLQVPCCQGTG